MKSIKKKKHVREKRRNDRVGSKMELHVVIVFHRETATCHGIRNFHGCYDRSGTEIPEIKL